MPLYCLIPAAGKGTRMRPLTHTLPKAMLPIASKPSIFHIIDKAKLSGVKNFVIITGYLKEKMESEILEAYPELNIDFVEQTEQKGLGHACRLGKGKIKNEDQLLNIYGDTLFEADLSLILGQNLPHIGVYPVEDPRRFGIVEADEKGYIKNLAEKPDKPTSNLAISGVNFFPNAGDLFQAIDHIVKNDIKTKNEYQITDAFTYIISEKKIKMKYFKIDAWYDCGTPETMLDTNARMLKKAGTFVSKEVLNSKIIDPVYIAQGAEISNSTIGPNVSIAHRVAIRNSKVSNSIIDTDSQIDHSTIEDSLIGRDTRLEKVNGKLILGDDSHILSK